MDPEVAPWTGAATWGSAMAMFSDLDIGATSAELDQSRAHTEKMGWFYGLLGILTLSALTVPEAALAGAIASGAMKHVLTFVIAAMVGFPILLVIMIVTRKQADHTTALM